MAIITKRLENLNVVAGAAFENKWVSDANYRIKKILITRHDGARFTASTITIRINEKPITKDSILCLQVGSDVLTAIEWNQDLPKDSVFDYAGTNNEGVAISLSVTLLLEVL
jgi:hypothetical protein